MAADPPPLPVVGHQDHRGAVELAALLEEAEEVAHVAVGLRELVEVLGVAHAAHVAELVGGQQLKHEQVRVLLLHHAAALGAQRAVDLAGGLHRGDRAHDLLAERVEQVRDPHQPAAAPVALEHVEDGLAAHAEPRGEVGAHAVLGRRGAGEHRREADDGARRVGRLDAQVLGALAGEPVHDGRVRLPEAAAVAAVDHDHVHPLGQRLGRPAAAARGPGSAAGACGRTSATRPCPPRPPVPPRSRSSPRRRGRRPRPAGCRRSASSRAWAAARARCRSWDPSW